MKFKSYHSKAFQQTKYYSRIPKDQQIQFTVLSKIFHFKVNNYVLENLIDWDHVLDDPIYKLVFPRKEMLPDTDYNKLYRVYEEKNYEELPTLVQDIKDRMFPRINYHESCIPILDGNLIKGAYRVFNTSLALYPTPMVRTCHSYCSYCFRWIAFNDTEMQNTSSYIEPEYPVAYLKSNPEISEVVFSGADPLVLKAKTLKEYIDPILEIDSVQVISITTKSLAWWPYRFNTDTDAEELLALFRYINSRGKHLNIIAHFTHAKELESTIVENAVKRIRNTGTVIRCQGPLVKGVNDTPKDWIALWEKQIRLGLIPYYMLMEADHNKESCFRVPLAEALEIFNEAQKQTPGVTRNARGPIFVNDVYRVLLDGKTTINGSEYFVLKCLQGPSNTQSEGKIKLIPYDKYTKDTGNLFELFNEMVSIV